MMLTAMPSAFSGESTAPKRMTDSKLKIVTRLV